MSITATHALETYWCYFKITWQCLTVLKRPVKERFVLKNTGGLFYMVNHTPEAQILNLLIEDKSHRTANERDTSMPLRRPPRILLYWVLVHWWCIHQVETERKRTSEQWSFNRFKSCRRWGKPYCNHYWLEKERKDKTIRKRVKPQGLICICDSNHRCFNPHLIRNRRTI